MQAASSPNYSGPLTLGQARSLLALAECSDAAFTRDGPRADAEYRDLGLAARLISRALAVLLALR